jgi:hypothetical protein
MRHFITLVGAVLLCGFGSASRADELVVDGSFEQGVLSSLPGWTVELDAFGNRTWVSTTLLLVLLQMKAIFSRQPFARHSYALSARHVPPSLEKRMNFRLPITHSLRILKMSPLPT